MSPAIFRAAQCFKNLVNWLEADDAQVAQALGLELSVIASWEFIKPPARAARRLYEFHAVLASLVRVMGPDDFREWLFSGDPSPRSKLLAGDLEALDAETDRILFSGTSHLDLSWTPEDRGTETS